MSLTASAQTTPTPISVVSVEEHKLGIELYKGSRFAEAADYFRKAVKKNKQDELVWYYLGLTLTKLDKLKDASKAFENALKIQPNFAGARTGLSFVLLLRNKQSDALREAQRALAIDSKISEAHYIVGFVRLNAGLPGEALMEAREAISLNPEMPAAYLLKSQALLGTHVKKALQSRRIFRGPTTPPTAEQLAERRKKRAETAALFKEAAESLEVYLRLNPSASSIEVWREQLESLKVHSSYGPDKPNIADPTWSGDEVTTKARVLEKPEPAYTESARKAGVTGVVIIRAVFTADGSVRHILVLSGLPNGLTEAAIRAARRIKFVPATIDGRPVPMFIQLEYNFNLY